jgi:HAMP domain-containing protein
MTEAELDVKVLKQELAQMRAQIESGMSSIEVAIKARDEVRQFAHQIGEARRRRDRQG